MNIFIALIIGLVVGGITLASLLSQLKSVAKQYSASEYVVKNSFDLHERKDVYLYTDTDRRMIQQVPPPGAPGGNGGSGSPPAHPGGPSAHSGSGHAGGGLTIVPDSRKRPQ